MFSTTVFFQGDNYGDPHSNIPYGIIIGMVVVHLPLFKTKWMHQTTVHNK